MKTDQWKRIECSKTTPCLQLQGNLIDDWNGHNGKKMVSLLDNIGERSGYIEKNEVRSQKYNLD